MLNSTNLSGVSIKESIFSRQIQETAEVYLSIPNDDLLWGFRKRRGLPTGNGKMLDGWYGSGIFHVFGQIVGGLARLYKTTGDVRLRNKAETLLTGWAECMEDDGFALQNNSSKCGPFSYYEYEKLCGGLNDCIEFLQNDLAKECLSKLTDWAIMTLDDSCTKLTEDHAPNFEWYTVPENCYRAYLLTGDEKYKEFAKKWEYPLYWDNFIEATENLEIVPRHAYSHVNTFSSAAMAYRVTGEGKYLSIIKNAYDYITSTQIYATGGYGPRELMFKDKDHLGKTLVEPLELCFGHVEVSCCSWAVFKLCRYLLEFTGEAKYADWAEKVLYNCILPELMPRNDGKLMYYAYYYLEGAVKNRHDGRMANGHTFEWCCCSGTFPQAIAEYSNLIYWKGDDEIRIAQYIPSVYQTEISGKNVVIEIETDYPNSGMIKIKTQTEAPFTLKLRKPQWANQINVDGKIAEAENGWISVDITGNCETDAEIELPLYFNVIDDSHPDLAALCYGPVVLTGDYSGEFTGDMNAPESWIQRVSQDSLYFISKPGTSRCYPYRSHSFKPFYMVPENEVYYLYHKFHTDNKN